MSLDPRLSTGGEEGQEPLTSGQFVCVVDIPLGRGFQPVLSQVVF